MSSLLRPTCRCKLACHLVRVAALAPARWHVHGTRRRGGCFALNLDMKTAAAGQLQQPNDDQVDCDDVAQKSRHNQNQDACHERYDRADRQMETHRNLWWGKAKPPANDARRCCGPRANYAISMVPERLRE